MGLAPKQSLCNSNLFATILAFRQSIRPQQIIVELNTVIIKPPIAK